MPSLDTWSPDLTLLCEQLAVRMAGDGARHAVAASLALAVRGLHGSDPGTFAAELALRPEELARIEAGDVAIDELPPSILDRAEADPRLDLDRLRAAARA